MYRPGTLSDSSMSSGGRQPCARRICPRAATETGDPYNLGRWLVRSASRNGGPFSNQVRLPSHSSIAGSNSAPVCPPRWLPASISSSDSHLKRRIRRRFVLCEQPAVPMGLRAGLAGGEFTFLARLGTTGRAADSEFPFCHCGHDTIHCFK
jgi:hypothetical protein